MAKSTICCFVAIASYFLLQNVLSLELESFLVDTLDSTMLALERDRATTGIIPTVSKVLPVIPSGGSRWRSSRRRRFMKTRKRIVKPKKKVPLNKNLQAVNQIQKGILEANAMKNSISEGRLQQQIKQACNSKQFIFARQMLGHNIFNDQKSTSGKRGRRSAGSASNTLMKIKNKIGEAAFKKLLAYDGGVTLAFALDTTGSMRDEKTETQKIVGGIVNYERIVFVDYVLSPFNDPITDKLHGPVTYMDKTQKAQFLEVVNSIKPDGGGDCKELAITGISEIFSSPLQYESPIYVLTDAGAKDATDESIEVLKALIDGYQTPVNFFLSNTGCLRANDIQLYKSLADYSGGQVLYFSNKKQIGLTNNLVGKGLIGGSVIPVIPIKRKRRGIGSNQYSILVDDSVETLSITVLDQSGSTVYLRNPAGALQLSGKINTGKGALYLVEKPAVGLWSLSASSDSYITSKCISYENIHFEYNFLVRVKLPKNYKVISSNAPIKGQRANVIVTVPAHGKVIPSTLKLKVVDIALNTLGTVTLTQHGKTGGRYKGSFPTSSRSFRLVLEGRTKANRPFSRLGNGIIKPKSVIIHIFSAPRGFALTAGSRSPVIVVFALHNYGASDVFEVKVDEPKKFITRFTKRVYGVPNRMALFTVAFKAPSSSKKGQAHNVVVTVVGKSYGAKSRKHVQLLVV